MKFQSKVYNVIVKSKLIEVFSERKIDKDIMREYYELLEDQNIYSRYIYNLLDICFSDMKTTYREFKSIKNDLGDFFREVIEAMQEIMGIELDVDIYVDLWLYSILGDSNNVAISLEERIEILSSMSMGKRSDNVELCFQILYLGEYIEVLLREQPVNLELIRELTANLSMLTQQYNATIF